MCIASKDHASRSIDSAETPTVLRFTDFITSNIGIDARKPAKSYDVDVTTPLGSPAAIVNAPLAEQDISFRGHAPQPLPGCQNIDWHRRIYPPKEGGWWTRRTLWRTGWLKQIEKTDVEPKYWGFNNKPRCFGQDIFTRIYNASFYSGITACCNPECQKRKEAFAAIAPQSAWVAFRDFLLTCLACKVAQDGWDFLPYMISPKNALEVPKFLCIDIRGILDLCMWSLRISRPEVKEGETEVVPHWAREAKIWRVILSEYESDAISISQKCHDRGLCPNRLWNASFHGFNTSVGVVHLGMAALEFLPLGSKDKHTDCTAQYCLRSHDNSTLAKQAHKCPDGRCTREILFRTDLLDQAIKGSDEGAWFNTAWSLRVRKSGNFLQRLPLYGSESRVMGRKERKYMAISHVWSDGTGVGLKTPGKINLCLYEYFASIAEKLDCDGLWWDAISIPSERIARATAIERMLDNFENAKITLVHDQDLVNFPWRDDGSPAIALVLSSWFTRGWTAAELFASRSHPIKILYSDPENPHGDPLIKDLDGDVLAADVGEWMDPKQLKHFPGHCIPDILNPAGTIPRQGYVVAAETMKRIRHPLRKNRGKIELFTNLINILSRRTTSWVKDQMLIAGLMCQDMGPSTSLVSSSMTGPEIMKSLLTRFERIEITDLLHGEVPITTHGPWSWCPQSIFHFGQVYHSPDLSDETCQILPHGRLHGGFRAYEVLDTDVIIPCGSHPAIRARVSAALSDRRKCLLISTPCIQEDQLYILIQPVYLNGHIISGRWVACVHLQSLLNLKLNPDSKDLDLSVGTRNELSPIIDIDCQFGNDVTSSGKPLPPLSYDYLSLAVKIGELIVKPEKDTAWTLSVGVDGMLGEMEPRNWGPQPIYLYGHEGNMMKELEGSSRNILLLVHPSTILAWDFNNNENMIQMSFFTTLRNTITTRVVTDNLVILSWSFPYNQTEVSGCTSPQYTIFESLFRIVPEVVINNQSYDMSLGLDTFEQSIKPLLIQWYGSPFNSQFKGYNTIIYPYRTCRRCRTCERRVRGLFFD
ncbi:hypothetical protein F4781DRAFT_360343 [Annulohypoxylon bovei var. microspora]|nr:hypothetical protein F4781DRAFT_360343 [Annulohypoxylon bovei var. microspora]